MWTCPLSGGVVVGSTPPSEGVAYASCDAGLTARDVYLTPEGLAAPIPPAPSRFAVFSPARGWVDLPPAEYWVMLRRDRDRLLRACDWTQMPDAPLSEAARAAWQSYRQALRDLPANTSDPAKPDWPTLPL